MLEKKTKIYLLFILPGCLFLAVFMLIPLFSLIFKTFFDESGAFSLANYFTLLQSTYFQQVFWRSIRLSLISTIVCAGLGFPTAYYISKYSKNKGVLMALAVFPMFTSPVIRSFSWMVILGKKGIVNQMLVSTGLIHKPISLLYNEFSMVVGFIQLFLPLMILSLIGVMDNISEDLNLAAGSLGASKMATFRHVVLPLSIPGLVTGRRSRLYRMPDCVHDPSAFGRYRYPSACDDDLSAGDVFRRLDTGFRSCGCDDCCDDSRLEWHQRNQPKVKPDDLIKGEDYGTSGITEYYSWI